LTISIAIDGPAGAGKSTIARLLAEELNFAYLDSGAMYRAVTLKAIENEVDLNKDTELTQLVKGLELDIIYQNNIFRIYADGRDITDKLRIAAVDNNVSRVAQIKSVRDELVKKQREIASKQNIVMDGRDIGTRVLPNADFKFYITATVQERAHRRYKDILKNNEREIDFKDVKKEIIQRDKIDSTRQHSPLKKAEDAVIVESTNLSIKEVLKKILNIIEGSLNYG